MKAEKPSHIVEQDPLEGGGFMYWVAGIFLAIAVAGFAWTSQLTDAQSHDSPVLMIALFGLLGGAGCLLFAVVQSLRFRKFGHSTLETDTPVAGSPWKGRVRTGADLATKGNYVVTLEYEEEKYDGKEMRTVVIWKATDKVDQKSVRSSAGIPFQFAAPGKELKKSGDGGVWWLKVTAPMAGVNYQALFNVTFLLDEPPKDTMPCWGAGLTELTR